MTDDWAAWEGRLGRISEAAEMWAERTRTAPQTLPNSALRGDDGDPRLKVSNIAWYPLVVAVEHLQFALTTMQATQTMWPTSYMTTLRTALLTASQTVWILSPSQRRVRQGRALRLRVQDIDEQRKLVESAENLTADQEQVRKEDLEKLKSHREECRQVVADLGLEGSSLAKLNNTDIIKEVAKDTHDDPTASSGAQLLWRTSSAAAHGQRMYAMMRMNNNAVVGDPGRRVMVLQGDLVNDVGPIAAASTLVVSEAFRLLDLRSGFEVEAKRNIPDFIRRR